MKTLLFASTFLVSLLVSQDLVQTDPHHSRVVYEDAQVRAVLMTFAAGEKPETTPRPQSTFAFPLTGRLQAGEAFAALLVDCKTPESSKDLDFFLDNIFKS